jgi:hypothetical protein
MIHENTEAGLIIENPSGLLRKHSEKEGRYLWLDVLVHIYNPNYSRGRNQEDCA